MGNVYLKSLIFCFFFSGKAFVYQMSKITENVNGGSRLLLQIRPFWKIPSLEGKVVAAIVIVTTSVIGGFSRVHLISLANVTVRLHCPITTPHND